MNDYFSIPNTVSVSVEEVRTTYYILMGNKIMGKLVVKENLYTCKK